MRIAWHRLAIIVAAHPLGIWLATEISTMLALPRIPVGEQQAQKYRPIGGGIFVSLSA